MLRFTLALSLSASLNVYANEADEACGGYEENASVEAQENLVSPSRSKAALTDFLSTKTLGNDGFYNKILSPSKSLNLNLSATDRTAEANSKIVNELDSVLLAFTNSTEDNKLAEVRKTVSQIDPDVIKKGGVNIQFTDGKPSAGFSRILIMIEKKSDNAEVSAERLMSAFSSYKRSALPATSFYEYSDSRNISQSSIKSTEGSDESWKLPQAAPEIAPNQDLVLKKCRQIFGWKCATSIYQTGQLLTNEESIRYLYAGIYDLKNNPDHPTFAGDKRSFNQITGSTALYVVKESANWILLYGVDSQWNEKSISFAGLIQEEFLKDSKRIKERISLDLKLSMQEIK